MEDEKTIIGQGSDEADTDRNYCWRNEFLRDEDGIEYSPFRQEYKANCIFVVGVLGMSKYTSHYSLILELEEKGVTQHPVLLSEGIPITDQVKEKK